MTDERPSQGAEDKDQDLDTERSVAEAPATGDARVDDAVAGLSRLQGRPAEECREALQALTNRLGEMPQQDRSSFFSNRTFSCYVTDLGITFVTRITDAGAEPVKEAAPDEPPADIRLTANSDDVVSLAATPANIARMWMAGRVQIQASIRDLLALRRLL